jgi:hypothetical protein
MADNLISFICLFFLNLEASTSLNPQSLSRFVMGLVYLYFYLFIITNLYTSSCKVPPPQFLSDFDETSVFLKSF